MRITGDNAVKTRYGEYNCANREQAEALFMSLYELQQKAQRERHARARQGGPASSGGKSQGAVTNSQT